MLNQAKNKYIQLDYIKLKFYTENGFKQVL